MKPPSILIPVKPDNLIFDVYQIISNQLYLMYYDQVKKFFNFEILFLLREWCLDLNIYNRLYFNVGVI